MLNQLEFDEMQNSLRLGFYELCEVEKEGITLTVFLSCETVIIGLEDEQGCLKTHALRDIELKLLPLDEFNALLNNINYYN